MPERASLTLIVPGMDRELANTEHSPVTPRLAHLAARGAVRYAWQRSDLLQGSLSTWQRGLLWALQLAPEAHPSAALTALANGLAGHEGHWLHADPVHLAAGLNHLSLVELAPELQPTSQQSASFEVQLREHLEASGWQLHALRSESRHGPQRWLVQAPRALELTTFCPGAAAANELERALPQGTDAAQLRRLMTELQMLLHEHPMNQQRELRGDPAVNSIWLWGGGRPGASDAGASDARPLPQAFGTDDYLRGVYGLHDRSVQPAPASGVELLTAVHDCTQAIAVLDVQPLSSFEHQWLVPLSEGLRLRRLAQLDLVLDGWHLSIDRAGLRRFWRRPLPPGSWVA